MKSLIKSVIVAISSNVLVRALVKSVGNLVLDMCELIYTEIANANDHIGKSYKERALAALDYIIALWVNRYSFGSLLLLIAITSFETTMWVSIGSMVLALLLVVAPALLINENQKHNARAMLEKIDDIRGFA